MKFHFRSSVVTMSSLQLFFLFRYMKNIRLTKEEPFVEFSTSGVNKLVKLEIMNVKIGETRRGKYVRTGKVYSRVSVFIYFSLTSARRKIPPFL